MSDSQRHRSRTRLLVSGVATAAVALSAVAFVDAAAVADAVPTTPGLVAATSSVTATRYVSGKNVWVELDLGTHLIAGSEPLEIRAKRASYKVPVVGYRVTVKDGVRTETPLPASMVTSFDGLKNFTTITVVDAKGKKVKSYNTDFCPNGYGSARTRRDAPADNPYPRGCGQDNPFTLGAVWGVQAGWNAMIDSMPGRTAAKAPAFSIPAGKYTATVSVNPQYRTLLNIPAAKAVAKVNLTVKQVTGYGSNAAAVARLATKERQARAAARGESPEEHGVHAGQGDPNRQLSAYNPQFRPPARRPMAKAVADIPAGPRPDLRSLPAWGISLAKGRNAKGKVNGRWYVNFGATVWNAGDSPLLVDGFRRTGTEVMDAYQYFFDAQGKEVGSVNAGTMEWDKRVGHLHWHFTDFAQYRLLKADKTVAVNSGKEAFCLVNTDAVDYTVPNAKWRPTNTDLSSSCGENTAVAVREVLDVGNGDTYSQDRPGQSFDVTKLPNGTYYIEVLANPSKKLTESNTANNSALRRIKLSGTKAKRKLTVPAHWGIKG